MYVFVWENKICSHLNLVKCAWYYCINDEHNIRTNVIHCYLYRTVISKQYFKSCDPWVLPDI